MAKLATAMDRAKYAMTADMAGGAMAGDDPHVSQAMDAMAEEVTWVGQATHTMDPLHQHLQIYQNDRNGGKHLLALTEFLHSTKRMRGPIGMPMPLLNVVQQPAQGGEAGNTEIPVPPPEPAPPAGQVRVKSEEEQQAETAANAAGGQDTAPHVAQASRGGPS